MFSRGALGACRASSKVHLAQVSRSLATAAESSASVPLSEGVTEATVAALRPHYKSLLKKRSDDTVVQTGIILNRSPTLTRKPTPFERTYYAYQARIERALHNPLPTEFYFKPGSLLEGIFNREENARERKAWGRPGYKPKTKASAESALGEENESGLLPGEEPPPVLMSRTTEADRKGDVKSLDRKGDRNLYLLVQAKDEAGKDVWRFPQTAVDKEELLHEAVHRELQSPIGLGMDTWVVSRKPVGLYRPPVEPQPYLFFYKAHILAGQVRPDGKSIMDFAWLSKEEIAPRVDENYWDGVKDLLSDL
ncbi:39S mitochondrial ribosomal protein L46 [Phanerochaete sordida]|uniref:Large ribosomal subunit protein mL46 n=1 Tax=Phanerochaete sordida TaxID=48140 RepID=A0A9P3G2P8_9APHY|nr:39S mitochondrial ribosomal protein L46 [Phanerochaete sordida]